MQAQETQRQQQQGLGKPIISTLFHGYRFVTVGGQLFYSQKWKTFHDFLDHYYAAKKNRARFAKKDGAGFAQSMRATVNLKAGF